MESTGIMLQIIETYQTKCIALKTDIGFRKIMG